MKLDRRTLNEIRKKCDKIISNKEEIIENLSRLILKSIDEKIKDKVGIAFSGGLDSTLIAFLCKKLNKDFELFSVGFEGSKDLEHSREIAKKFRWKLNEVVINEEKALGVLKKVLLILDTDDFVKISVGCVVYCLCEKLKEREIRYLVTGGGSEDIFAGYKRHLEAFERNEDVNEVCWESLFTIEERDLKRDLKIADYFNISLITPFLDSEIIEYGMKIDAKLKINKECKKVILRETAVNLGLDKEMAFRKRLAAQYGSGFDKFIEKYSKKKGFKFKKDLIYSLRKKGTGGI